MTVVSPMTYLAVNTRGDVAKSDIEYAKKRVDDVVRRAGGRALFARVKLTKRPDRLRARMQRLERDWEAIRGARPLEHAREWRHSAVPTERAPYFPRPIEEREVIRHKGFSLARMTVDEAAFDMEMLDYNFHLLVEETTGIDSGLPFVFFRDEVTHRGCVRHHRYDGHYGLIAPAA